MSDQDVTISQLAQDVLDHFEPISELHEDRPLTASEIEERSRLPFDDVTNAIDELLHAGFITLHSITFRSQCELSANEHWEVSFIRTLQDDLPFERPFPLPVRC